MKDSIEVLEKLVDKYETDMEPDDIEEFHGFIADARNATSDRHYTAAEKYLEALRVEQAVSTVEEVSLIGKDGNELFDLLV